MKIIPWIAFALQLLFTALSWLMLGIWLASAPQVCSPTEWNIFLIFWTAGLVLGLIAPGAALRLGAPAAGLFLLACTFGNLMLWVQYGDLATRFYC